MDRKYDLWLYVAGNSPRSLNAVERAKSFCETHLDANYSLTIVDLYQQADLAATDQIVAVPALVRKAPLPRRQMVGDLSNEESLRRILDLAHTLP